MSESERMKVLVVLIYQEYSYSFVEVDFTLFHEKCLKGKGKVNEKVLRAFNLCSLLTQT